MQKAFITNIFEQDTPSLSERLKEKDTVLAALLHSAGRLYIRRTSPALTASVRIER